MDVDIERDVPELDASDVEESEGETESVDGDADGEEGRFVLPQFFVTLESVETSDERVAQDGIFITTRKLRPFFPLAVDGCTMQ